MTRILQQRPARWLSLMIGFSVIAALLSFQSIAFADVAADQVPADLQAAIKAKVESEGHQYAGLCNGIDQSASTGKYCAMVLKLTSTEAEVTYGPVASEPTAHIVFFKENGTWSHPGGGPGEGPSSEIPADLAAAIKKYVESKGHQYAGLCSEIAQDGSNDGKYCANVVNLTATTATVAYGPVASDALQTVQFEKANGAWGPRTTVSNPGVPKPPSTGSGFVEDGKFNTDYAAAAALGSLLAITLGLFAARKR